MNATLRLGTCLHVLFVLGLAAHGSCGGGTQALARTPANHRAGDTQCAQPAPAGTCSCSGNCSDPIAFSCSTDGDCAAGANGRCLTSSHVAGCYCAYDKCAGDGDCPSGQTCACKGSSYTFGASNTCVPGNCHVDTDCGAGGYCSPTPALPCDAAGADFCQGVGYYCHTPKDQCVDDSDCGGGLLGCLFDPTVGYWKCHSYTVPL